MRKRRQFIVLSIMMLILLMAQTRPIQAENDPDQNWVQIINSSSTSITFKVTVPLDDLVVEQTKVESKFYTSVHLPGYSSTSEVGAPQLPFLTEVLGVPFDSEVKITITPGKEIRRQLHAPVIPVASESVVWDVKPSAAIDWDDINVEYSVSADPKFYEQEDVYPVDLGVTSNDAVMRSQQLVSIALFPVRYDLAVNELVIVESLTVKVDFIGFSTVSKKVESRESPVYEQIFQNSLLNYEQAKDWRTDVPNGSFSTQAPWTPPVPGWRINVRETGMYKLTFAELEAAGVPLEAIDLDTIQMFHLGTEIAIKVLPEQEAIVFFGEEIESKYTKDNVYWLTYGVATGLRMQTIDGTPVENLVAESYLAVEHFEENSLYRSRVAGSDDLDRYMWNYVYRNGSTVNPIFNFAIDLENRFEGDLTLTLMLMGYLQEYSVNPDHLAGVLFNGTPISEIGWDGYSNTQVEVVVPQGLLLPGINTLEITALPTGHTQDFFFIDWLEIEYEKVFASESGQLKFSYDTLGQWKFVLTEFIHPSIQIFDITDEESPKWLENVLSTPDGITNKAEFSDTIAGTKDYFAVDESGYLSVEAIEADNPSDLTLASSGADYLMISHADFLVSAAPLQVQKTAQGYNTVLIDVQDIYDEFGYGITDVYAIRDFIAYAYENSGSSYVLLIGDGHFDPKDNEGFGRTSFIPPFLANIDPTIVETAADNRYVAVAGDDRLPDLMLGRLSVNTEAEAQAIISKIIAYETNPLEGDWKRQILAVTDKLEPGAHYPLISESLLEDYFPSEPFQAEKVYWQWNYTDLAEANAAIENEFNNGTFLVNYIGHGAFSFWGKYGYLFGTEDIPSLLPQTKLPIIVAMTCMEGYFLSPYPYSYDSEALAEVITRTNGKGAVASWSPTGWGSVNGHDFLDRGFFKAIYQDGTNIISQATNTGLLNLWASGDNLDLLDTFLLFGDPALQLPLSVTAVRDEYSALEDQVLIVAAQDGVLSNDINPQNSPLSAILVDNVTRGTLSFNPDGSFTYMPNPDYSGSDSFSYKINDGLVDSNVVLVQINVNPANDPPVAENQVVFTSMNTSVDIELTAIDDGPGDPINLFRDRTFAGLTFEIVTHPSHGTLSGEAPFLVYTPGQDYTGADQFTFKANDGEFDSNVATVLILVGDINTLFLPTIYK